MKPKMQHQVQSHQVPLRSLQTIGIVPSGVPIKKDQAHEDVRNFLLAIDSYPARVAKEPRLSFHEHLCSIFAARDIRRHRRAH
jgi:hypothetical protein